jgi:beta-galactosidase
MTGFVYFPMRLPLLFLLLTSLALADGRQVINFNPDWKFVKADPAGAETPAFNDAGWAEVSAPHTFNDTDTFDNWSLPGHRGEQEQWSGRTWYRKHFDAPADWEGKKVFIEFEAVRQVAEVYLNGVKLGTAKGGFTPFGFDLTTHLKFGAPNVLAVMADNRFMKDPLDPKLAPQAATTAATHPNLAQLSKQLMEQIPATLEELQADQIPWNNPHWHPAHGGIYRNVRLIVTDSMHIGLPLYSFLESEGPYAYATDVTEKSARIGLEIPVRNHDAGPADAELSATIFDSENRRVFRASTRVDLPAASSPPRACGSRLTRTSTASHSGCSGAAGPWTPPRFPWASAISAGTPTGDSSSTVRT